MENKTLADLKPDQNNARKHNPRNIGMIADSIAKVGVSRSIVVDEDMNILAGNGTVEAAGERGITKLRIVEADGEELIAVMRRGLTKEQKKQLALADNRTAELAEWDADVLKDINIEMPGILDTMFTPLELDELLELGSGVGFEEGEDEAPEPPEKPISKLGDLYQLGEHRLLCGDSTAQDEVFRLMGGEKADMVFTDPPYNVDYGANKHHPSWNIRPIENDAQTPAAWENFCKKLFERLKENCVGDIYMWGAPGPEGMKMRLWLVEMGCHWSATIIWKKQQLVLSPAKYQRIYEPCFYGWFDKSSFVADRKQTEHWEFDRPHVSELHPTMKPLALCGEGIKNSSSTGQIVMDLFGGSGSTLIACEKLDRKCYMMEIDPAYCDVIVKRWEDFTGKKAELISDSVKVVS